MSSFGLLVPEEVAKFSNLFIAMLLTATSWLSRFLDCKNFCKNYGYCDVTKLRNAGLLMVRSQTDYIVFSRIKGIVEKGLGHFYITSSSSQFFKKTDFDF